MAVVAPAALIVAPPAMLASALRVADKLADGGITVRLYRPESERDGTTGLTNVTTAIETLRPNRAGEGPVGVIVFGDAASILPSLVRDTTLAFIVAVRSGADTSGLRARRELDAYAEARVPTLVVRPHSLALDTAVTWSTHIAMTTITSALAASSAERVTRPSAITFVARISPMVTLWPLSPSAIRRLSEPLEPIVDDVVRWVQMQTGVRPSPTGELRVLDGVVIQAAASPTTSPASSPAAPSEP